ncbi:MAG TPA: FkbM family methyltransferase [Chthoniobacterales bacterium]
MLQLIDRYFLKQPAIRCFMTKLLVGSREESVNLLARNFCLHTVREHGFFRASKLAQTCSLFRDEIPVLIHLAGILNDGDTFLDIGANIGIFAVNIASFRNVFANLKIYAFEPNGDTARRLRANAEPLGVKVLNMALSDRNGTLEFVDGAVSNVFTTIENASSYSIQKKRSVCECRRLDGLKIDGDSIVMKIDVEGQEWEVLQGASSLFQAGRVKALYLDDFKDARVRNFLDRFGFRYFNGRTLEPGTDETRHLLAIARHTKGPHSRLASAPGVENHP